MRTLHAALWWGSPPFKICLCFYLRPGLGSWASPGPRGPPQPGHGSGGELQASLGEVGARAPSAREEAARKDLGRRGCGELVPHELASSEAGRITGKGSARLKCQGHGSRQAVGAEMWVTAAEAPGMLGGVLGPGPSLGLTVPTTRHRPAASSGKSRSCW